jgi:SAM-dependent methyltransferase
MSYAAGMVDWDARYTEEGWAFGTEPNDFLREQADQLPPGRVLCLAEGQGRNGVWLAQRGYDVTAMDQSAVGLRDASRLAAERGVTIATVRGDLDDFAIEPGAWQGIVSIFAHVDGALRARVHARVERGLAPGGVFLLEAYRPEQIGRGTGGPPDDDRMVNLERLRRELRSLEFVVAREVDRDVLEGTRHRGMSSVVQLVARRRG